MTAPGALRAHGVTVAVKGRALLDEVDLEIRPGRFLGVLGPNGAGKTTLLRALAGVTRPDAGRVTLDGRPVHAAIRRATARRVAVVEQHHDLHTDLSVFEIVMLGRTPYRRAFGAASRSDSAAVETALETMGLASLRSRRWSGLSGGERQRVHVARALAQEPDVLLLDEPTNHLDVRFQLEILALLRGLGITVVAALHELNLAARFCHDVAVLEAGRVVAAGPATETLDARLIERVYAVRAVVETSPHTGAPTATFLAPTG
ncbi:ABC transporter ATP-binding protein [Microbacterium marinilacus]|uniref:ABC transporter ATP-binding protein n=1 Tax=Microbacterium marinilacus TaxID=415209 RepID=A0ABP7B8A4_9MICO|nr:ABC transporter ATP-binding protein [Microbacterium marinilacus]MBY0687441.1 ABC transporter ATP-binding protein [Microbacterium marinilacus]